MLFQGAGAADISALSQVNDSDANLDVRRRREEHSLDLDQSTWGDVHSANATCVDNCSLPSTFVVRIAIVLVGIFALVGMCLDQILITLLVQKPSLIGSNSHINAAVHRDFRHSLPTSRTLSRKRHSINPSYGQYIEVNSFAEVRYAPSNQQWCAAVSVFPL